MKLNIKNIVLFIVVVVVLVLSITLFLNWTHRKYQVNQDNEKEITGRKVDNKIKYETVMNKNEPVYQNIDKYLKKEKFNGAIAIYHNGQLEMNKGYGYQNIGEGKKSDANSMYLIGSAQKFTTGLMLKKLETEGKVNINDPITKYLPWFKTSKPLYLRDIMLHQSGLKKYQPSDQIHSIDGAAHWLQKQGIQPGMYKVHQYNDGNYILLARVIEAITKESYAKYFNQNFATPFNLDRTAFYNDEPFKKYMASGYNDLKFLQKPKYMDQYYGAGNLYMAPKDMARLILDLQDNKIFSPAITNELLYEVQIPKYPGAYRYGFYSYGPGNRINGVFFGQQMTSYFNKNYVVVMGNNYQHPRGKNEKMLFNIFVHQLHQPVPTKMKKQMNKQLPKHIQVK